MTAEEIPVLIVGGSLVGLTTAMLLGHHGVPSLAGEQLATYVHELNEGVEGFSPTVRVFINQDALEPLLRARALELGAAVRNRTEAVALEPDDDGVTVTLRDLESGDERAVRAGYVVAADGNRSPIRTRLGIAMRGQRDLSKSITIYFRADCSELLRDRNQGVIYVHNPRLRGFFRLDRRGGTGFLVINTVGEDVTQDSAVDVQSGLTEERALQYLRTAIGTDMPMELVDVANWRAEAMCAERLREGRVFLAGDAAHVVPPNGGFGGNAGVQDALNLAWKLAAVIKGEAGPELLDTYEAERLPLCELTVEQAYTRYATRVVPERGTEGVQPPVPDINLEIGLVMRSAAIASEEDDDGALHLAPAELDGRPGTRAPHVVLAEGRSTLDLFGSEFVLLRSAGDGVDDWAPPGVAAHVIDAEGFAEAYGLAPGGATLVRPDGVVAWRSRGPAEHSDIERALATALALDSARAPEAAGSTAAGQA